jgi:CheY-like chemotaxis protein
MKKILVVDDEPQVCSFMKEVLEGTGEYQVKVAYSVPDGLIQAKMFHPDAITLDIVMPGFDGTSFVRLISKDPILKKVPVLILSAYIDDKADVIEALKGKVTFDQLQKPFEIDMMLHKLKTLMAS